MMANKFLIYHNYNEDETLIPIKDIAKVVLDVNKCTIDFFTYGGEHFWEDCFSNDGTERLARFREIVRILNDQQEEQTVYDNITKSQEELIEERERWKFEREFEKVWREKQKEKEKEASDV